MASSLLPLFFLFFPFFSASAYAASLPFPNLSPLVGEPPQDPPHDSPPAPLLAPILSSLGFQELAAAAPSLSSPLLSPSWTGPLTIFAPSDDSIRSCGGVFAAFASLAPSSPCSPLRLLKEHLVPGLFSLSYLSKLSFGTKLETASPGRCLTVTSTAGSTNSSSGSSKIFVDGVEITRADLFNDGRIVIHGLQGFVAPLSPLSCSLGSSFSPETAGSGSYRHGSDPDRAGSSGAIVRLMLRDAILRLREGGYSILALAMRVKFPELAGLQNMTVFALDDPSIFGGGHAYVTEVRFHVVPNRLLMHGDLVKLPVGTVLPTLVQGQHLVVTQSGGTGPFGSGLRINYVPIKGPDVVYNSKIAVHSLFFPFPRLYLADLAFSGAEAGRLWGNPAYDARSACGVAGSNGAECKVAPAVAPAASMDVDLDDDGL